MVAYREEILPKSPLAIVDLPLLLIHCPPTFFTSFAWRSRDKTPPAAATPWNNRRPLWCEEDRTPLWGSHPSPQAHVGVNRGSLPPRFPSQGSRLALLDSRPSTAGCPYPAQEPASGKHVGPLVSHHPGPVSSWASLEAAPGLVATPLLHACADPLLDPRPSGASPSAANTPPASSMQPQPQPGLWDCPTIVPWCIFSRSPRLALTVRLAHATFGPPMAAWTLPARHVHLVYRCRPRPPQLTRRPTPWLSRHCFVLRLPAAATPCFGTRLGVRPLATGSPPSSTGELIELDPLVAAIWTVEQELLPAGAWDGPTQVLPHGLIPAWDHFLFRLIAIGLPVATRHDRPGLGPAGSPAVAPLNFI